MAKRAAAQSDPRPNILFCIADDLSWASLGAYGERAGRTPNIDRLSAGGVRFTNSYCVSPSCTPSRASLLTGQEFFRLEESGNLWSALRPKFETYPERLEKAGYTIGLNGKGWSPGNLAAGGRTRNPAGPDKKSFEAFLAEAPPDKPFCFWWGSVDPHRVYEEGSGLRNGIDPLKIRVPPFLPDTPEMRSDIADYLWEVERFDRDIGTQLAHLEKAGRAPNTLVVVTSDNGMPFPRGKANCYDYGARMPLIAFWPGRIKGGRTVTDFVSHIDLAPTFLEAAGEKPSAGTTGRSFLSTLTGGKGGRVERARDHVFLGRERHARVRENNVGYPIRAVRTDDFLYIRNLFPDRWPAGDPPAFGDIDNGSGKAFMRLNAANPKITRLWELATAKRPAEELYDLKTDPFQLNNVAAQPAYQAAKNILAAQVQAWRENRSDPQLKTPAIFDTYPYYGNPQPIP